MPLPGLGPQAAGNRGPGWCALLRDQSQKGLLPLGGAIKHPKGPRDSHSTAQAAEGCKPREEQHAPGTQWPGFVHVFCGERNGRSQGKLVTVPSAPPQIDGSTLRTLCLQHGPLITFHLNLTQGNAVVRYSSKEEAAKAQKSLHMYVPPATRRPVSAPQAPTLSVSWSGGWKSGQGIGRAGSFRDALLGEQTATLSVSPRGCLRMSVSEIPPLTKTAAKWARATLTSSFRLHCPSKTFLQTQGYLQVLGVRSQRVLWGDSPP